VDKRVLRDYLGYLIDQKVAKVSLACKLSASFLLRYLLREGLIACRSLEEALAQADRRLP
jgi:hypothetical protein